MPYIMYNIYNNRTTMYSECGEQVSFKISSDHGSFPSTWQRNYSLPVEICT